MIKPHQLGLRFVVAVLQRWGTEINYYLFTFAAFVNGRLHNADIDLLHRRFCHGVANNISDNMLKTAFKLVQLVWDILQKLHVGV
jgi:hypothetical protein